MYFLFNFLFLCFYDNVTFKLNIHVRKIVRATSFSKWPPISGWMGPAGPLHCNPRLNTATGEVKLVLKKPSLTSSSQLADAISTESSSTGPYDDMCKR